MDTAPILVTGASSGIGNSLVQYLVQRGHTVFATARQEKDLETLGQIEGVIPRISDLSLQSCKKSYPSSGVRVLSGRGGDAAQ